MGFKIDGKPVNVTKFPDGTSQVWQLDKDLLLEASNVRIQWDFEDEGEVMQLLQLVALLRRYGVSISSLHIPYLPYARQDKAVSNSSCFALKVFAELLATLNIPTISAWDIHSDQYRLGIMSLPVDDKINGLLRREGITHVCFPDSGAASRYSRIDIHYSRMLVCHKERDELTGKITKMQLYDTPGTSTPIPGSKVLIVDDICDGGWTFTEVAKILHAMYEGIEVQLYVSHGIFSKGTKVLYDAGISTIYTKDGKVERE